MTDNSRAVERFLTSLGKCQIQMERIQEAINDHLDVTPDDVNWANVGDAGRLQTDLTNIVEYIGASQ